MEKLNKICNLVLEHYETQDWPGKVAAKILGNTSKFPRVTRKGMTLKQHSFCAQYLHRMRLYHLHAAVESYSLDKKLYKEHTRLEKQIGDLRTALDDSYLCEYPRGELKLYYGRTN